MAYINDLFYDPGPDEYEAIEIQCDYPDAEPDILPLSGWKGPVSSGNVERCTDRREVFISGFGDPTKKNRPKKYIFYKEYAKGGNFLMWRYMHCAGKHHILIRKVKRDEPYVHIEMEEHLDDIIHVTADKMTLVEATRVTAVAERGETIMEAIIFEDVRFKDIKNQIKERCVLMDICTRQQHVPIYWQGVLMTGNLMLRAKYADNLRRRDSGSAIVAKDDPRRKRAADDEAATGQERTKKNRSHQEGEDTAVAKPDSTPLQDMTSPNKKPILPARPSMAPSEPSGHICTRSPQNPYVSAEPPRNFPWYWYNQTYAAQPSAAPGLD